MMLKHEEAMERAKISEDYSIERKKYYIEEGEKLLKMMPECQLNILINNPRLKSFKEYYQTFIKE